MNLKKLLPIIGLIILIILLLNLDFQKIVNIFSKINPVYSTLSFFAVFPLIFLANFEWQMLLKKQKIKVSYWYTLKNIFIGYFYGFITPGAFGAYTRSIYLSHESKTPLSKCLTNIIIFNTIDYISLLILGLVGAVFISSINPNIFYSILLVIILIIILSYVLLKKEISKNFFTKLIQSKVFATMKDKLEDSIDSIYEDLPRLRDVSIILILSELGWILKFLELFFIAILFSINVPFVYFILIMAVGDVIASIPISIYGLGTREAVLVSLFTASSFNVLNEAVVSLSIFWFVITWIFPSIIGFFITYFETKKLNDFFYGDQTIENFAKYMEKYPQLYNYLSEIVKNNISISNPCIVDLGAGPGLLSRAIFKTIPNAKVIGIDPLSKMLNIANKNVKNKNFKTIVGSSEKIPLEDNSVDLVVRRFSLTYWKKPKISFSEIYRVLKSDGKVVLEVLNKDFSKWRLFLIKIHMKFKFASSDVIRYHIDAYKTAFTIESVKKLLKDADFKIIYEEGSKKDWKFLLVGIK